MAMPQEPNYYQILELEPTASLSEIKKAYRRLALKTHPDRNPPEQKEEATIQFRRVNEAYEVLSDPEQRQQYDLELKHGPRSGAFPSSPSSSSSAFYHPPRRQYRDAFSQFNDLFHNDPFFQEAFKDMDDLFAKTFQQQQQQQQQRGSTTTSTQPIAKPVKSWGGWFADLLGIDIQVSTSHTTFGPDGRAQTSRSQTQYGNRNNQHRRTTYTSKSTRTVIENGQRVTIQSMEQDGNKIEEKYINNQLVQRLINGVSEQQYRLNSGGANSGDL